MLSARSKALRLAFVRSIAHTIFLIVVTSAPHHRLQSFFFVVRLFFVGACVTPRVHGGGARASGRGARPFQLASHYESSLGQVAQGLCTSVTENIFDRVKQNLQCMIADLPGQ
jgi:hypothetical protein